MVDATLTDRENEIALALIATIDPSAHANPEIHELIWKVRNLLRSGAVPKLRGRR